MPQMGAPTPWTQLPGFRGTQPKMPYGYQSNPISGQPEATVGSPSDQLQQRDRSQAMENQDRTYGTSMASASLDALRKAVYSPTPLKVNPYTQDAYTRATGLMDQLRNGPLAGQSNLNITAGGTGAVTNPSPAASVSYNNPALDAARSAAFARAKDNAANTADASMKALTEELGRRGMQGGGYEAGQIGNTLAREADQIGEAGREQAIQDANFATHAADENFQGAITQRGQDISAAQANAQRQLEASMENARLTLSRQQSLQALMQSALGTAGAIGSAAY